MAKTNIALLDRPVLTISAAAELIGVDRGWLTKFINKGDLPSIRLGRKTLIRRCALDRWLERHEQELQQAIADMPQAS